MEFIHLHVHSSYSLLQGAMRVNELTAVAAEHGMPAVALTDTNGIYGAVEFFHAAEESGVLPLIGAEIVFGPEQCVLLAADRTGYANLCRIVTRRCLFGTPHYEKLFARSTSSLCLSPELDSVSFDLAAVVGENADGLFVLTATPSLLKRLHGHIPRGRLFAELRFDSPHSYETFCPSICGLSDPCRCRGPGVADLADHLHIPFVATANVSFIRPEDRPTHVVLSAIRENTDVKSLLDDDRMLADPRSRLMSAEEVAARLPASVREEAMHNTVSIAEQCMVSLDRDRWHFPQADLKPGQEACDRLRQAVFSGARRRYGSALPRPVQDRLDRELSVIAQLNFCDYFLVVRDIIDFAEREDIPHVGRGSAANSIVSYCLGISAVCPLEFELPFERFLNEFRTDVPDIDIDFGWRRRDDVIDYVYRRYGAERVAMVSTHSTLQARSAFRDVARVMGLPLEEIDAYSKMLPHYGASSIGKAMHTFPEMAHFPIDREPWRTVVQSAMKVDGYVRHLSIHLGGMVIADSPLTHYTALENSAKGIVITQYEMDSIEAIGLVKMDLLGQRSLSIVAETARNVEKNRGIRVNLNNLPDRDERTAELLKHGRTMGCFQIESPGMRQLLQMQQAETIMDLIQGLSLIRPGPSSSGMKHAFIRRSRGEEPITYPTPLMKNALEKTYGVMLYQEDTLRVAREVAGFSLAEGDELRKAVSKHRSRKRLAQFKERFVRGAAGRGIERTVAEDIWTRITDFAAYSYCKAHATTYGHISYQASYLKAHWPAEFLASVIANKAGFYDPRTYLEDARRFNVRILPPCVNHSEVETRPEHVSDGGEEAIRPGLEFVKELTARTVRQILGQRLQRPFRSLQDFHGRVRLSRQELENLILCGAFDCLGRSRPVLMMQMEGLKERRPAAAGATPLFDRGTAASLSGSCTDAASRSEIRNPESEITPFPVSRRVLWELQILGFGHSGHPLDAWDGQLRHLGGTASYEMANHVGEQVTFVGWLVTMRRAVTKNHEYMKFLTLEDRHGVIEAVLFPDIYRQFGAHTQEAGCYRVTGRVDEEHGAVNILADDVQYVPPPQP